MQAVRLIKEMDGRGRLENKWFDVIESDGGQVYLKRMWKVELSGSAELRRPAQIIVRKREGEDKSLNKLMCASHNSSDHNILK